MCAAPPTPCPWCAEHSHPCSLHMFDFDELDTVEEPLPNTTDSSPQSGTAERADASYSKCSEQRLPPLPPHISKLFGTLAEHQDLETIHLPRGSQIRVMCISDIHVDAPANRAWLLRHVPSRSGERYNVLILPGDVSDESEKIRNILKTFADAFDLVCFTPGNHDVWVLRKNGPAESMEKLREVLSICKSFPNVFVGPVRLVPDVGPSVLLVPLLSWYSLDWDREPELPWAQGMDITANWTDFAAIRWPEELLCEARAQNGANATSERWEDGGLTGALSEIFARANEAWLPAVEKLARDNADDTVVISFSHFVPRQELFPEKRFLIDPGLHKVVGSSNLEAQIRRLKPSAHVFGHTHIPMDAQLDGQRYVQWPLGTPGEQRAQTRVVADTGMLVLYDFAEGGFSPEQHTYWGHYLNTVGRHPAETCPAPWVRRVFASLHPNVRLPFDDALYSVYNATPHPGRAPPKYDYEQRWRC